MKKLFLPILAAVFLSPLSLPLLSAADNAGPEVKLREALRNTMLQLRTAETDRANLQATQAESDQKIKELTSKLDKQIKQTAEDKKDLDDLNSKITNQDAAYASLKAEYGKSQGELKQASELAKAKEEERAKLSGDIILLQRHVAELQTKNMALFKLGNEILSRYEKFGLGTALTAREPFTGLTRTKLENLVQDYQDKLSAQTVAAEDEKKTDKKNRDSSAQ